MADKQTSDLEVDYNTQQLRRFCEASPEILGTIENLRHHFHGTPKNYQIDGCKVLHQHVTGGTALAFCRIGDETLKIMAYGIKSDSAMKGTGGYDWYTKP